MSLNQHSQKVKDCIYWTEWVHSPAGHTVSHSSLLKVGLLNLSGTIIVKRGSVSTRASSQGSMEVQSLRWRHSASMWAPGMFTRSMVSQPSTTYYWRYWCVLWTGFPLGALKRATAHSVKTCTFNKPNKTLALGNHVPSGSAPWLSAHACHPLASAGLTSPWRLFPWRLQYHSLVDSFL